MEEESDFARNVRLQKEKRDAKIRNQGADPLALIDKKAEQKVKELIESDYSKKENTNPAEKKKKTRFAHLVERQKCWDDEFEIEEKEASEKPKPSISDPEPPRKRFEVKTASQQVAEILKRQKKVDAKETPAVDRFAKKKRELETLSEQKTVTRLPAEERTALSNFKITNQAIEEETRAALESQSPRVQRPENMEVLPLEESNISEECVETLNTLNSVIEDFDQSPVVEIDRKLTEMKVETPPIENQTSVNNNKVFEYPDCSSIIDMTKTPDNKRKVEEGAGEQPEPKKQNANDSPELDTAESVPDSGIYDDQPIIDKVSSIQDFRKSQRVKKITAQPSVLDIWSVEHSTLKNTSRLTTLKRNDDNRKREKQKEGLRDKIRQLSTALNLNTHTKLPIDRQIEARVECEKQLLFATEEYEWLQDSVRMYGKSDGSRSKGTLEVSDILIKTNPAVLVEDPILSSSRYFVVGVITVGNHFYTTEVKHVEGLGEITANGVNLKVNQIFTDLSPDFVVNISLYCYEANPIPQTKPRSGSLNSFVSSMFGRKSRRSVVPPVATDVIAVRKSGFKLIGQKKFDLKSANKFERAVRKVTLQQSQIGECDVFSRVCHFKLTTNFTKSMEYSSFLTIKLGQDKGYGAWIRYWAEMRHDVIHFWKYKEDAEADKESECSLLLRQLLNKEIRTPRGFSLRKNSFELYAAQWSENTEPQKHISGVTLDYDKNKFIRYFLATDTSHEKQKWCDGIQTILDELRIWDASLPAPLDDQLGDY